MLQAYEIFRLKLSADLVVLSACRNSSGAGGEREGLVGLDPFLLLCGGSQPGSEPLECVRQSDTGSDGLLLQRAWTSGTNKAEALRRAKLADDLLRRVCPSLLLGSLYFDRGSEIRTARDVTHGASTAPLSWDVESAGGEVALPRTILKGADTMAQEVSSLKPSRRRPPKAAAAKEARSRGVAAQPQPSAIGSPVKQEGSR